MNRERRFRTLVRTVPSHIPLAAVLSMRKLGTASDARSPLSEPCGLHPTTGLIIALWTIATLLFASMLHASAQSLRDSTPRADRPAGAPTDKMGDFVSRILGSLEVEWAKIFSSSNAKFARAPLILFSNVTHSACGLSTAVTGPFYCSSDRRIYLDTSFFRQIENKYGGCEGEACQFSWGYVIAHEYGHHIQNLLGILPKVEQSIRATGNSAQPQRLRVSLELQADCLAGIWAHHLPKDARVTKEDVNAGIMTASAMGDDRMQLQARGYSVPDSFTHGTSEQRVQWFMTGYTAGTVESCNTFRTPK